MFKGIFKKIFKKETFYEWRYENLDDYDEIIENTVIKNECPYNLVLSEKELNFPLNQEYYNVDRESMMNYAYTYYLTNKKSFPEEYVINTYLSELNNRANLNDVRIYLKENFDRFILREIFELKCLGYVYGKTNPHTDDSWQKLCIMSYIIFMRLPEELLPNIWEWVDEKELSDIVYNGKTLNQRIEESNLNYDLGFVQCVFDLIKDTRAEYKSRGQVLYLLLTAPSFGEFGIRNKSENFLEYVPDEILQAALEWLDYQEVNIYKYKAISLKGCIWAEKECRLDRYLRRNKNSTIENYINYENNKSKEEKLFFNYCLAFNSLCVIDRYIRYNRDTTYKIKYYDEQKLSDKKTFYREAIMEKHSYQ